MAGSRAFRVVHSYRTHCASVKQPPGLGDFLRGSIALAILSNELNFDLELDFSHHPIGLFTNKSADLKSRSGADPVEFFGERTNQLREYLEGVKQGSVVEVTTNGHYCREKVDDGVRACLKSGLSFNRRVMDRVSEIVESLALSEWVILHLRVSDDEFLREFNDKDTERELCRIVGNVVAEKWQKKIVVVSNSEVLKRSMCQRLGLPVVAGGAVHLGECSGPSMEDRVLNTLADFQMIANSSGIYSYSPYGWQSGFSKECAAIYNVPFFDLRPMFRTPAEAYGHPGNAVRRLKDKIRKSFRWLWRS